MERIWLKNYPPGVPENVDLDPQETLVSILERTCREHPERPAFTNFGSTITYRELDEASASLAAYLQACGLKRGDRVALMMPNCLQFPIALYGILRAGLASVNVNPLYTARELKHQLADSGSRAIIIIANAAASLESIVADTDVEQIIVTQLGDHLSFPKRQLVNFAVRYVKRLVPPYRLPQAVDLSVALKTPGSQLERHALTAADLACVQYTGGTTGLAKGAMLSHGNLVANVRQINTWFSGLLSSGQEIVMTALPLYHVYALTCNCLAYVDLGARNILITDPRETAAFIKEMRKWPFTCMTGVNTLYQSLVDHPDIGTVDFSSLKLVSAGGMAVQEFTAKAWAEATGTAILEGYGLSETSPVLTSNPPDLEAYSGTIGMPLPGTDISLRDDSGNEVPLGEAGELCASGPQVMSGYWQNAEATANAMTADGFFKTGDIAVVDELGRFKIVDRKKDMILVSGFNVYPNEVENVLTLHPDINQAACIGYPHEGSEVVKAFVVLRPGATMDVDAVRDWCRDNLAAYKVPKLVEFRDDLPKSTVGKILRRALRD